MRTLRTEYEDYSATSSHYDQSRQPVGLSILLGCLSSRPGGIEGLRLLDAGCGSGLYAHALHGRPRSIVGLEYNAAMLSIARAKRKDQAGPSFLRGNVLDMPFPADSFDALMANQVLHHLDSGQDADFSNLGRFLEQAHRVLTPGGSLIINTCSHRQIRDGYWWAELIEPAIRRISRRFMPMHEFWHSLEQRGFKAVDRIAPLEAVLQGNDYLDPLGPLQERVRNGDSVWSLLSEPELQAALQRIRDMHAAGELNDYFQRREALRLDVGQCTFVHAVRL